MNTRPLMRASALFMGALSVLAGQHAPEVLVGAAAYAVFAVLFAVVAFGRSPAAAAP